MAESIEQEQQSRSVNGASGLSDADRADALIAQYFEPHPGKPGIAEYRLRMEQNGYPVWAIIGSLAAYGDDMEQMARDYKIAREAIEAVCAFYALHREAIDDRLAANRAH